MSTKEQCLQLSKDLAEELEQEPVTEPFSIDDIADWCLGTLTHKEQE
jgi:hypothetical protein